MASDEGKKEIVLHIPKKFLITVVVVIMLVCIGWITLRNNIRLTTLVQQQREMDNQQKLLTEDIVGMRTASDSNNVVAVAMQKKQDEEKRNKLKSLGYHVEVIRYNEDIKERISKIMNI